MRTALLGALSSAHLGRSGRNNFFGIYPVVLKNPPRRNPELLESLLGEASKNFRKFLHFISHFRVAKVRTRVPRTAVVVVTEPTPVLVVAKERKNELTTALQNGGSMVVVLSGPPGCGKSVLLHTVCDELGLSVTEYRSKAWVRGRMGDISGRSGITPTPSGYEERHALVRFLRTPLPLSVKLIRESVLDLMSTRQSAYSGQPFLVSEGLHHRSGSVSEREVLESLISARGRVAISTTNYRLLDKLSKCDLPTTGHALLCRANGAVRTLKSAHLSAHICYGYSKDTPGKDIGHEFGQDTSG